MIDLDFGRQIVPVYLDITGFISSKDKFIVRNKKHVKKSVLGGIKKAQVLARSRTIELKLLKLVIGKDSEMYTLQKTSTV